MTDDEKVLPDTPEPTTAHSTSDEPRTHFGFEEVPWSHKKEKVAEVFHSVAERYDIMNDVMSMGLHRLWKHFALSQTGLRTGMRALDCAGGTGDLAYGLAKQVGPTGQVILSDINSSMLEMGREKLENRGLLAPLSYAQIDVEQIPYPNDSFDCITIGFGLRNVTDKDRALREMFRCLKPGGRLLVLEFSKPQSKTLGKLYDAYSFHLLPKLGKWIAQDERSYRYLAESIRKHPDQETLKQMMVDAGFSQITVNNLSMGIVALHRGFKI
jgi:demethylmenaquinone methyltransferase / 2-methoxy-6-polyprenyl-1,4-benzoquinol methylase